MSLEPSSTVISALLSEFARRPRPVRVAVTSADVRLVDAVVDQLGPDDTVTVLPVSERVGADIAKRLTARASHVRARVNIHSDQATQADASENSHGIVICGQGLRGDDIPAQLALADKLAGEGGILSLAVFVDRETLVGMNKWLDSLYHSTIRHDLVLRNRRPVRILHLRLGDAPLTNFDTLTPATRPSSVGVTRKMHIDSNGIVAGGILGAIAAGTALAKPKSPAWLVPAALGLGVTAFFRDPERTPPSDPRLVVAPADGRVLSVEMAEDSRFSDEQQHWLRIAIFLSVFDVHVNRSPVGGRVTRILTEEGRYANAATAAAEHNAAQYTVLETSQGAVVVAQRTGLIARRIVNRARVGAELARGERFGLIRFGSRTDVYLPADAASPLVVEGDRVRGGETSLARWI